MRQIIVKVLVFLFFIGGVGLLSYPILSNEWNNYVQSKLIGNYQNKIETMDTTEYEAEWNAALDFNSNIKENALGTDVFGVNSDEDETKPSEDFYESKYYSVLNLNGDGIMAYLSIPKINLKLPIMHGTFDEQIQTAVGHMNGTALPIGGAGTHSVIVGHRGLPTADLFTNIDQLQVGDKFYIHVLDETHAYEVDMIHPKIEADDIDTLTTAMQVEEGKDYITLFTCTPYGVNTHRLLVRGTRVEYLGEDDPPKGGKLVVETVKSYYLVITFIGIILVLIIVMIIKRLINRKES
ncbi:MAG: class C sortase [Pseudobutyrivibrio sp.]|uniref:class C sortase n=1 Tax=Pseudobutyrivibrio sp. TaxID=2014367 RepID=UPI0025F3A47E|nr:class C sortase [Pseudobutyrivibrio sp.]MBQ8488402.1 class C sortase [Pseudobutyrivibrio sp.]